MKLASFEVNGRRSYGAVIGDRVVDLGRLFSDEYPDLRAVLKNDALPALAKAASHSTSTLSMSEVRRLPVIGNPQKVLCVGSNYKAHVSETKRSDSDYPVIFTRFADTLIGDGAPLIRPRATKKLDFEGEMALVIGRGGRNISQANAMSHVAGYACFNDVTARDWQRHTHQWTAGKNFPGTAPFGPFLVTRDEIPDLDALTLTTRLNGRVMQHGSLADLIFTIPVIIEYVSGFTSLQPGDVIATGTPGGGRRPSRAAALHEKRRCRGGGDRSGWASPKRCRGRRLQVKAGYWAGGSGMRRKPKEAPAARAMFPVSRNASDPPQTEERDL